MRGLAAPLVKLIIFLVITALAFYVLAVTIANSSFGSTYSYKADFSDVTGLNISDDVRIAGVRVGTIEDIKLIKGDANRPSYSEVDFTVQKTRWLPKDVVARLRYRNLVGQRYLDIQQDSGNDAQVTTRSDIKSKIKDASALCNLTATEAQQKLAPGSTIPECHTYPAVDLTVLFEGFSNLTAGLAPTEINKLSDALVNTLNGQGDALTTLLSTVSDLTNKLADKDSVIGNLIDDLSSVLQNLANHDTELSSLIVELKTFLTGLAGDRTTIGNAIDGINNLATSTAGLLTQIRPPLKADIKDITGLVDNLNANSGVLTYVIKQLPPTVAGLIRTAQYGSWFNFYLCHLSAEVTLAGKPLDLGNIPFDNGSNAIRGCAS